MTTTIHPTEGRALFAIGYLEASGFTVQPEPIKTAEGWQVRYRAPKVPA